MNGANRVRDSLAAAALTRNGPREKTRCWTAVLASCPAASGEPRFENDPQASGMN